MQTLLSMQANCPPWRAEHDLIQRIGRGEVWAFDELYVRYAPSVYAYALHLTGNVSAAEDIAQETFLSAWIGAKRFRGDCRTKTWLVSIAHHQAVSWWRKQRPAVSLDDDDVDGDGLYDALPDPRQALTWPNERLQDALAQLNPNQRAVIDLTFWLDMSQAEIAQVTQCSIGTVKSRMHYALLNLQRALSSA